jgi:hypothetical protein
MAKPTSDPWTIHLAQTVCVRPVNSDTLIARCFGAFAKAEANARLIVRAVNSHADLLEACKETLGEMRAYCAEQEFDETSPMKAIFDQLKSAIAKAEGKEV